MARLILSLLFIPLLFTQTAQASWSPEAIRFADNNFGDFPGPKSLSPAQRGALAAVWGGGMRTVRFNEQLGNDEHKIKLPDMFRKELRIHLRKQDAKAPLMVVIPGVFANSDDAIARGVTKWFSKMGYHVLTMPNCWSRDFAKAGPIFKDEYPGGEARVVTEITKWAIREIGAENVTNVGIYGESLGALTAAVVYARDSQTSRPIFTNGATLTWPPVALFKAISTLDDMMASTKAIYDRKCRHNIKQLKTKWRVLTSKYLFNPTDDEVECAPSVVAQYSFRKELIKLAKQVNETEKLGKNVPDDLTFEKFVHNFAPRYAAAMKETDEYGNLKYWMNQTSPAALQALRIITSEDDFLNDRRMWDAPGFINAPNEQLIIAKWGGHIGLTDTKSYEGLLQTQFRFH